MSTMTSAMNDLVNFRSQMDNASCETVSSTIAAWRKVARSQPLVREQFALTCMIDAMVNALHAYDITLAYEYKGTLYAVHKDYRTESRGGVFSTEYLHKLNLSQAEWDAMPKHNIWVNTGKIFAPCL